MEDSRNDSPASVVFGRFEEATDGALLLSVITARVLLGVRDKPICSSIFSRSTSAVASNAIRKADFS